MPFYMRIIMYQDLELVGSVVYLGSLIVKQHAAVLSLWHVVWHLKFQPMWRFKLNCPKIKNYSWNCYYVVFSLLQSFRIDEIEDDIIRQKLKIQKVAGEMNNTFDDMITIYWWQNLM